MNSLTVKEAKAAKITRPVTRSYPDTEANRKAIFEPVLADFERDGIPCSIVTFSPLPLAHPFDAHQN
jgi:hypothetical protein